MGNEEASIPGVVAATVFAFLATVGHTLMPDGHHVAWLCLYGCSVATFFASFKPSAEKAE
jgi:hypothetical protein